jgi:DNA-binding MarR family transcriptional regulator
MKSMDTLTKIEEEFSGCDSDIESNQPQLSYGRMEGSTRGVAPGMPTEAARSEGPNGHVPQRAEGERVGPTSAPPDLFNARQPVYELQAERPEHRIICFLSAQGYSITEIAQKTGWTKVMVGYIVKQPWAKALILKEIHEKGGNAVALVLQREALPSIEKLIELRDSDESQKETQRKAANDLLDRIYGKAAQLIVHQQADLDELSDEELAKLATQGRRN